MNDNLTTEQIRFVAFHRSHAEVAWQWLFQGNTLRAQAGRVVASISADALGELVDMGLVEPIRGAYAGVWLTEQGRACA